MLLERPLSLKLIFHYYNQINRQRDRIIWMRDVLTNFLCFPFFYSLFHFTVFVAGLFLFLVFFFFFSFFFFFFSSRTLPSSFLFCFSFFLFASNCSSVCWTFVLVFFLLLSIPAFFFVLFLYVVLWCLKLSFTVTRFILSPWKTLLAQAPNYYMLYSHLLIHAEIYIYILDTYRCNNR